MSAERLVEANGVRLCVQTFGDPADPAVLLIHGACASMLYWEEEFCLQLADRGRFVIRYDSRDTGRSVSYPVGRPGYTLRDLAEDAVGLLDVLGVERAHVLGRSMSGAIALLLGVDHPERVASLTFVTTTPGDDDLPPMSAEFLEHTAANPDPADDDAVVEFIVGLGRAYSGSSVYFDEKAARALAQEDVARTVHMASALTNHFAIDFDGPRNGGYRDITAPTLVIHGELDPVFPLPHGEALREAIPGAELLVLPGAGHELPPALWPDICDALHRHTS